MLTVGIYLEEFDFESFENDFSCKGMIAEKLSLLKVSNPLFRLDYEEVSKNAHLIANPPLGVNSYDYKG